MKNTIQKNNKTPQESKDYVNLKFKKPKPLLIITGIVLIIIIAVLFFVKGVFVAATINGSSVSRLSVIQELERQGGKQVLEAIINEKIIETELSRQEITITKEEVDEEIKKIEAEIASQGSTLEIILTTQGVTEEEFREQIATQKKLEKLLADKIVITDAEVDTYLESSNVTPPEGVEIEDVKKQISEQLKQQKFQEEAQKWVSSIVAETKIKYYVNY